MMNFEHLKELAKENTKQFISEGTTTSLDNTLPNLKFSDVLYRMYTKPLISMFGSAFPVNSPAGTTFSLLRSYESEPARKSGDIKKDYANTGETESPNQINFKVASRPVEFRTKKLKSRWTTEAIQDFAKMHSNRNESELSEVLSNELTNEIILELDYEAFDFMYQAAKKKTWNLQTSIGTLFSFEIIQRITEEGLNLLQNTSYRYRVAVFCSKAIAGKLMAHPNFKRPFRDLNETGSVYFQGEIGNIDIYADVFNYGKEKCPDNDYILIALKDPTEGLSSSILYFPYAISMWTAPAKDDSSDVVFYNVFRYGISQNAADHLGNGKSDMLTFVKVGYKEEPAPFPEINNKFYIGQIATDEAFFRGYNQDPEGYNFTNDIQRTLSTKVNYNYNDYVDKQTPLNINITSPNSFVWFAFEKGDEGVEFFTSQDYDKLKMFNLSTKVYKMKVDLGSGEKEYVFYITPKDLVLLPALYIRSI